MRPTRTSSTASLGSSPPRLRPATIPKRPPLIHARRGSSGTRFRIIRFHARGGWARSSSPTTTSCTARSPSRRSRPARRPPREPRPLPARGRDHRRAGASRHRAGLRPGHLRRRPAVLRHAVHQGRQPQGGDRAVPRRPRRPAADPGERTLELQKLLRRFLDVCNAIAYAHSRGVLHRD